MKQRIQKVLASAGIDSRRHVETMVLEGRVAVNGKVVTRLPVLVDPETDRITIDDEPIRLARAERPTELVYLMMNKPKDVYCTNVSQGEQVRAIDLLPPDFPHRVYPVGRLDADSKGLLLLTNDGDLANKLTHPRFGVTKTYVAVVSGRVSDEAIKSVREGVWLADPKRGGFRTRPSSVRVTRKLPDKTVLEISLKEGRNRQVRRVLAKLGHKVRELVRVRMGPLELGHLKPGAVRPLSRHELAQLREAVARAEQRAERRSSEQVQPSSRQKMTGRGKPSSLQGASGRHERSSERKRSGQRSVKRKPTTSRPMGEGAGPKRTIIGGGEELGEY